MGALRKELEPAKPTFPARPIDRKVSVEELHRRTMDRFPKVMARLAE